MNIDLSRTINCELVTIGKCCNYSQARHDSWDHQSRQHNYSQQIYHGPSCGREHGGGGECHYDTVSGTNNQHQCQVYQRFRQYHTQLWLLSIWPKLSSWWFCQTCCYGCFIFYRMSPCMISWFKHYISFQHQSKESLYHSYTMVPSISELVMLQV